MKVKSGTTRQLDITDERWNQIFGLPEGTKTEHKVIKMSRYLDGLAYELESADYPLAKTQIDDALARYSRNGVFLIGFVTINSGHVVIADTGLLDSWKEGDTLETVYLGTGQTPKSILDGGAVMLDVRSDARSDARIPVYAELYNGRVTSFRCGGKFPEDLEDKL